MKARDVMTENVICVGPGHSVRHAASIMLDNRISGVPVVDDDGRLVGMLTEGDLLRREELGFQASAETGLAADEAARTYVRATSWRVSDVMSVDVLTIGEDTPIGRICRLMLDRGVNRLPVIRGGAVVGIVSRSDLLRVVASADAPRVAAGDESLGCAIRARLQSDLGLPDVRVEVSEGCATLTGTVATAALRQAARVAAENVPGVASVLDRLAVLSAERKGRA